MMACSSSQDVREERVNLKYITFCILLLVSIFILYVNARFIVEDDEMVVITQFGKLVGETHKVPGEYFKIPFIQKTHYFKKYIILLEETHEIPTLDKKFITVKLKAQWRINDPAAFYKNFNSSKLAKEFISDEVGKAARQIVTSHKSDEQIFHVVNSDSGNSILYPYLEYEIKKMAADEISKTGLHLVHVGAEII